MQVAAEEQAVVGKEAEVWSIERQAVRKMRIVRKGEEELGLILGLGQSYPGSWRIGAQGRECLI
jgi:hypothetical protein